MSQINLNSAFDPLAPLFVRFNNDNLIQFKLNREMDQRLSEAVDAVTELSKKQKSVHEMLGHLLQDFNALKGQTQQQDPPMTIPDTQPYC